MKATSLFLATALFVAIGCNQQQNNGAIPEPPDRGSKPATEVKAPETETILLEAEYIAKFKVLKSGATPPRGFHPTSVYSCYNEGTKLVERTEGYCKGKLLHGKFAEYYPSGNLRIERFYYYGQQDSLDTQYSDETHEIITQNKWDKGTLVEKVQ